MQTYFCFSDETGLSTIDGKINFSSKIVHPFYSRSTLITNAEGYKHISRKIRDLKVKYFGHNVQEFKWAYLYSLQKFHINNKKQKNIPEFVYNIEYANGVNFVEEALSIISSLNQCFIIVSFTHNSEYNKVEYSKILTNHLHYHMQRIENEVDGQNSLVNLCLDDVSDQVNNLYNTEYKRIIKEGDSYLLHYEGFSDKLSIDKSESCVGLQLVDFVAGVFNSFLRCDSNKNNYELGTRLFVGKVYPYLRRRFDSCLGNGVIAVPNTFKQKGWIKAKLKKYLPVSTLY